MMFRLLKAEEIEVKIKQVNAKGAVALLYKTARTDMDILDETVGAALWTNEYKEIKGNMYCGIGIKGDDGYIWKWDCGIESREDEGNQKKGEASDAFKRAGFKWGIGRELYSAPFIFLPVETEEVKQNIYRLKDKYAHFSVSDIEYTDSRKIKALSIADRFGKVIFTYPQKENKKGEMEEKEQEYYCEFCKKKITAYYKGGKNKAPAELAEYTKKKYGHQLCTACASKLALELNQ